MGILDCLTVRSNAAAALIPELERITKLGVDEKVDIDPTLLNAARVEVMRNENVVMLYKKILRSITQVRIASLLAVAPTAYFSGKKKAGILVVIVVICYVAHKFFYNRARCIVDRARYALTPEQNVRAFAEAGRYFRGGIREFARGGNLVPLAFVLSVQKCWSANDVLAQLMERSCTLDTAKRVIAYSKIPYKKINMFYVCLNQDNELLGYLRDRGVDFTGGIQNYEAWQEEIDKKEESCKKLEEFLEDGRAGSFSISASFGSRRKVVRKNRINFTPVEAYLNRCLYEDKLDERGLNDFLTTFDLKGKIENWSGVDEIWKAINEDERGYRIRKSDVQKIFDALRPEEVEAE